MPNAKSRETHRTFPLAAPLGALAAIGLVLLTGPAAAIEAFPGAEGYGREAQGGRGGRIIEVTNLDDAGPGSLRACILETGPRNCVFRVAGVITLHGSLMVDGETAGDLSILGQTAPGDGITLTVSPDSLGKARTPLILLRTHDVLVRHLRFRPQFPNTVRNVDTITVETSTRVYLDHVSGSWATDENFNAYGQTSDLTVAYSIFGEGVLRHSKCALLGSDPRGPQNISFWRNICISNNDRNPDTNHFAKSCVEVTDNLFYNARAAWAEIFSQRPGGTPISYVGNYFKAGPSTRDGISALNWNDTKSAAPPAIYERDNAIWAPPGKSLAMVAEDTEPFIVDTPPCPLNATTLSDAEASYREVTAHAGAFPRDRADRRFLREIGPIGEPGSGKLRKEPGEIAPIAPAEPYRDEDGDGMPDSIEARFGADPTVPDAFAHVDDAGWSSFDHAMQWLSDERIAGRYPD